MSKKRLARRRRPSPTQGGLLDGIIQCGEHGCPMIRIGDDYVCAFDQINHQVGLRAITDILLGSEADQLPTRLVFEGGKTLPLLCPCCGEAQYLTDADLALDKVAGRILFAMKWIPPQQDAPEGAVCMVFSESAQALVNEAYIDVHWRAATGIQ